MPKYAEEEQNSKNFAEELQEKCVGIFRKGSPRSPLSTENPSFDVSSPDSDFFYLINGIIDTSIEQIYLYNNVIEMQSSGRLSSSSSFMSYGEESRIDSELRFLAGRDCLTPEKDKASPSTPKSDSEMVKIGWRDKSFCDRSGTVIHKQSLKGLKKEIRSPFVGTNCKKRNQDHIAKGSLGLYLLKQARDVIVSGNNSQKALKLAIRAMRSFEITVGAKSSLSYVMCLHVVAALYCRLGRYHEAIPVLERSIVIPVMELGLDHVLAKFAGCMQLGDIYSSLGHNEKSIAFYMAGLEIQRHVLGEQDSRFGNTCRYLSEAYVQALLFDEAEKLCLVALKIHESSSASLEEATDRQLMGLICESKGDYESALENYLCARMAMVGDGCSADVASVDCNIGNVYSSLAQYDEAVLAYQNALKALKFSKGDVNLFSAASVYVRLADLCCRIGSFNKSRLYCENALKIFSKPVLAGVSSDEIAGGLVEVSAIYGSMNEPDQAIHLLEKAMDKYVHTPEVQLETVAGIEAQMGVLHYIRERYKDSYNCLKKATEKLRTMGEKKTALLGIALNQMGLACVHLFLINEAMNLFEEARGVLEAECGSYHANTLGVYSNLAGTYDAMGRTDDAIRMLKCSVQMKERKLGKGDMGVEEEKCRLSLLLKERGKHMDCLN